MAQMKLLNPLKKINENRYEVYEGRKFIGYIEVSKVKGTVHFDYKYTIGLCYGGNWTIDAKDFDRYINTIAEGMIKTYRRRKVLHKEAWTV